VLHDVDRAESNLPKLGSSPRLLRVMVYQFT
jgi:hypothetical protein